MSKYYYNQKIIISGNDFPGNSFLEHILLRLEISLLCNSKNSRVTILPNRSKSTIDAYNNNNNNRQIFQFATTSRFDAMAVLLPGMADLLPGLADLLLLICSLEDLLPKQMNHGDAIVFMKL